MARRSGGKIVTDGLVLALDGADITSFRGEPTTNLLYDNGVINWTISNLTINVSRSTVITNSKYRITSTTFINPYTFGSFRLLIPLSKLTNGVTYTMSFKWKIISGESTFYMTDWNDTSLFNVVTINYDNYNYSAATGVRATYDNTYRFMDFRISENTVVEIWDVQLEAKSYATPFVIGTRGATVATGGGWADLSGNTNHGELVNGVGYDSGNGGSLTFDGSSDYVSVPFSNSLALSSTGSLSVWCYPLTLTQGYYAGLVAMTINGISGGQSYYIHWRQINNTISAGIQNNGTSNIISKPVPTTIQWYNFVFTWNGSFLNLYENGISTTSPVIQTITAQQLNTQVDIGGNMFRGSAGQYGYFNGYIPQVQIYNRALTAEEISQNFNATRGRFGI